jgi:hypothetical protein
VAHPDHAVRKDFKKVRKTTSRPHMNDNSKTSKRRDTT